MEEEIEPPTMDGEIWFDEAGRIYVWWSAHGWRLVLPDPAPLFLFVLLEWLREPRGTIGGIVAWAAAEAARITRDEFGGGRVLH